MPSRIPLFIVAGTAVLLLLAPSLTLGDEADAPLLEALTNLTNLVSRGEATPASVVDSIIRQVEADPSHVLEVLLPRITAPETAEADLAAYVFALGYIRREEVVDILKPLLALDQPEVVRRSIYAALSNIGTASAGELLVQSHEREQNSELKFGILCFLAVMKFAPALPLMEELLHKEPSECYWRCAFVFGQMGEPSVHFLLDGVTGESKTVRGNAIAIVAHRMASPAAFEPLTQRYWSEPDPQIRNVILSSLERSAPDLDALKTFFREVASREQHEYLRSFAEETLDNLKATKRMVKKTRKGKTRDPDAYQAVYAQLLDSMGTKGDYELLARTSTAGDEDALLRLRERILQRYSDEALNDYDRITMTIILNRWADKR